MSVRRKMDKEARVLWPCQVVSDPKQSYRHLKESRQDQSGQGLILSFLSLKLAGAKQQAQDSLLNQIVRKTHLRRILHDTLFEMGGQIGEAVRLYCMGRPSQCMKKLDQCQEGVPDEMGMLVRAMKDSCRGVQQRGDQQYQRVAEQLQWLKGLYKRLNPQPAWSSDYAGRLTSSIVNHCLAQGRSIPAASRLKTAYSKLYSLPLKLQNVQLCNLFLSSLLAPLINVPLSRAFACLKSAPARSFFQSTALRFSKAFGGDTQSKTSGKSKSRQRQAVSVAMPRQRHLSISQGLPDTYYKGLVNGCYTGTKVLKMHFRSTGTDSRTIKLTQSGVTVQGSSTWQIPFQNIKKVFYVSCLTPTVLKTWEKSFELTLIMSLRLASKQKSETLDLHFKTRAEIKKWVVGLSWLLSKKQLAPAITIGQFWWRVLRAKVKGLGKSKGKGKSKSKGKESQSLIERLSARPQSKEKKPKSLIKL